MILDYRDNLATMSNSWLGECVGGTVTYDTVVMLPVFLPVKTGKFTGEKYTLFLAGFFTGKETGKNTSKNIN